MAMQALQIPPDCDLCSCRNSSGSSGGGGTGGGFAQQYYQGRGEPNTTNFRPQDVTIPNLYSDLDTQIDYDWIPGEQRWV